MPLSDFLAEHEPTWAELEALVAQAGTRVQRLDGRSVQRLGALHRHVSTDLAEARRRFPHDPAVHRLESLLDRSRALVYATPVRPVSATHYLTTGYWQRVREAGRFLLVAFIVLWGSTLGAGVWAHAHPVQAARVAEATDLSKSIVQHGPRRGPHGPPSVTVNTRLASQIFTNNIQVAFIAFAGGLTGGLLTIASTLFNGVLVGVLGGWVIAGGGGAGFFRLIFPHGFLEWSLFTVASASGLRAGWALINPGLRTRTESLATEGRAAVEMVLGTALCLVPCGLVEGFVTPHDLPLPVGLAVGLTIAATYWTLVLWRGRPDPVATAPPG